MIKQSVFSFVMVGLLVCTDMAFAAGRSKDLIIFLIEKNPVKATITVKDNQVTVDRYYDKPYQGSAPGVSFRAADRSIYRFNCETKQVALERFLVIKPREKEVFKAAGLDWKAAHGPEFELVFSKHCNNVTVPSKPLKHPDEWITRGAANAALILEVDSVEMANHSHDEESLSSSLDQEDAQAICGKTENFEEEGLDIPLIIGFFDQMILLNRTMPVKKIEDPWLLMGSNQHAVWHTVTIDRSRNFPIDGNNDLAFWLPLTKSTLSKIARV